LYGERALDGLAAGAIKFYRPERSQGFAVAKFSHGERSAAAAVPQMLHPERSQGLGGRRVMQLHQGERLKDLRWRNFATASDRKDLR
jgi:hypothetical protein